MTLPRVFENREREPGVTDPAGSPRHRLTPMPGIGFAAAGLQGGMVMDELIARLEKHRAMSARAENEFSKGVAEGIQFTLDLLRIELHNQHLKTMGWIK